MAKVSKTFGYVVKEAETLAREHPEFWEKLDDLYHELLSKPSALDKKTKELIAIPLLIINQYRPGLEVHIDEALKAGVTPEEITEAVLLTMPWMGSPTFLRGYGWVHEALKRRRAPKRKARARARKKP
ncbi:MAG: carboxymuconolactone decarboxylase family protein [Nitrospinota bacterium]